MVSSPVRKSSSWITVSMQKCFIPLTGAINCTGWFFFFFKESKFDSGLNSFIIRRVGEPSAEWTKKPFCGWKNMRMPSFHGYNVFEGLDLSWVAPETGEASYTADSPRLAQMYFHLLTRSIYFSFHMLWLRVLDVGEMAVSEPKMLWWNKVISILPPGRHVLFLSVRMEEASPAPTAPSDTQCSTGWFSEGVEQWLWRFEGDKQAGQRGSGLLWGLKMPSLSLVRSPACLPPILNGIMSLALGQRRESMEESHISGLASLSHLQLLTTSKLGEKTKQNNTVL